MTENKKMANIKIKFGGKPNELNVNTFLKSLASISTIIDEINNEIGEGQKLEIKIKALDKGSFLIHLGLITKEAAKLITTIDWDMASKVINILVDIFTLRKFLKGKKPKEILEKDEDVTITTDSGNKLKIKKTTFNIYNSNIRINESLSNNFEALRSDSSIESFEFQSARNKRLFYSPQQDFESMSVKVINEISEENIKIVEELAILHIFKLVWDKNRKWEFYYRGIKISAFINDELFFKQIDRGENFAKGDSLEVDLQTRKFFNKDVNTFVNESYVIIKVRKHIPRPDQGSLDF